MGFTHLHVHTEYSLLTARRGYASLFRVQRNWAWIRLR